MGMPFKGSVLALQAQRLSSSSVMEERGRERGGDDCNREYLSGETAELQIIEAHVSHQACEAGGCPKFPPWFCRRSMDQRGLNYLGPCGAIRKW